MVPMDKLDYCILEALQNDFPLSERPYEAIARKLQVPGEQFWGRLQKLLAEGVIRRIGASLDSRKLGFCSTLAAVSVKSNLIEQAAEIIGQFPEVTHSYLRKDDFNIWFTLIAADEKKIEHVLESSQILNLPMKRLFKLNARFNISL